MIMKEFIKMLEDRNIINNLRLTEKLLPLPEKIKMTKNIKHIIGIVRFRCVESSMETDMELAEAFAAVCVDLGREALIKELEKILEDN